MYIIVGLGNPGEKYTHTRHNTGRMASDLVVGKLKGVKVLTLDTYMNKSGPAVAKAVAGKSAKKLIVIYDDLDLPLGSLKISYNRSSGGHKGVESIIQALKTKEFIRIRIGIGLPARLAEAMAKRVDKIGKNKDVEKHILGQFKKPELEILNKVFKRAQGVVEAIVKHGLTQAMTEFNS